MRQGCLSTLVCGCLIYGSAAPARAEGPFSRLRQRLGGTSAAPATPPREAERPIQDLLDAPTLVVRPAPPAATPASVTPPTPVPTAVETTAPLTARPFPAAQAPASRFVIEQASLQEPAAAPPMEPEAGVVTEPRAVAPQPLPQPPSQEALAIAALTTGFSLDQAEQTAISHNPSIRQADATAQKAMGTRRQIVRYPNPTIGYNADYIGDSGTAGAQGMFLQQTVMFGRKLELNGKVADWEVQMLAWQAEAQRRRVCNDVKQQFYATLGAQRRVKLAEELQAVANAGAIDAQQRFDAIGDLTKVDVVQAQVQAQEVEIIRANAYVQRDAEWRKLASLMGLPTLAYTELGDVLEQTAGPRDIEMARQQLLTMNPALEQARSEVQRASWRIQREQAQPIPNLQLQVIGAHLNPSDSNGVSIQAGLPVPLFNQNDGNVMRAVADHRRACWNVERLELSLQSKLAETYQQYQTSANKVAIYRSQILPQLTDAIELIQQNPSTFANLPMIIARRSYFEAQLNELQALVEMRQAEVALDGLLLTGSFNELVDNEMDDTNRWNALSGQ
jgi:cobalt-zinc-cadmium efflux system outer membrane protein